MHALLTTVELGLEAPVTGTGEMENSLSGTGSTPIKHHWVPPGALGRPQPSLPQAFFPLRGR